jgi:Ax21 family sulfation-dependent quorum factor
MKRILLAALAMAILPLAAQASDLSYTFLQGGYTYSNNNSGSNSHAWSGEGSAAVGQNFDVFAGGGKTFRDDSDANVNGWNLGGGFHTPVSGQTDFVADVQYNNGDVQGRSGDTKNYVGELGVRSAMAPHFEGWAMAGYSNDHNDTGDINRPSSNSVFGKLGGQYKFDKNWGLVAEGKVGSHNNQSIFVGPRISF